MHVHLPIRDVAGHLAPLHAWDLSLPRASRGVSRLSATFKDDTPKQTPTY